MKNRPPCRLDHFVIGQPIKLTRPMIIIGILLLSMATGCTRWKEPIDGALPYSTQPLADVEVNVLAQSLNRKGLIAFRNDNLDKAERLFREALEQDVSFGPAHNNLGQVLLARHQLYLAAWEFEYAANLMPDLAEPIINQGLAYETAEQVQRAVEFYQIAYEGHPTHPAVISSLVRARIKLDGDPSEIGFLLDELILHDGRQHWVQWARELRATRYRTPGMITKSPTSASPTEIEFTDAISGTNSSSLDIDPRSDGDITETLPLRNPDDLGGDAPNLLLAPPTDARSDVFPNAIP